MGGYLKPWRRKIGVVTLALACAFAAGWVRSHLVRDEVYVPLQISVWTCDSAKGHLQFCNAKLQSPEDLSQRFLQVLPIAERNGKKTFVITQANGVRSFEWKKSPIDSGDLFDLNCDVDLKRSSFWGFTRAAKVRAMGKIVETISLYDVSYWFIVSPLTLVSAWLLLSKPRSAKCATKPQSHDA